MQTVKAFFVGALAGSALMLSATSAHGEDISGTIVRTLMLSENTRLIGDVTCNVTGPVYRVWCSEHRA